MLKSSGEPKFRIALRSNFAKENTDHGSLRIPNSLYLPATISPKPNDPDISFLDRETAALNSLTGHLTREPDSDTHNLSLRSTMDELKSLESILLFSQKPS